MVATLLHTSLPSPKDFSEKTKQFTPLTSRPGKTSLLPIPEGRILRTEKNQGIDFEMLSSCFTLTAQFSDETLMGAHFAHFGEDAGGYNPKDLLILFKKVLSVAKQQVKPLISLQLIGQLDLWEPSLLGLSERCACSLSEARAQNALAEFLEVRLSKIKVIDTSLQASVRLSIQADGMPVLRYGEDNK